MNRLAAATSPYLLQHADNPVDWWEWTEAAFEEARRRGVPVFLSIGYSACHWCHVMAHESFEDPGVAAYLNEHFISIKVDREERPDIDSIYMEATVAMTGHGGWPMSVFLDHEQRPFYTGTYFPPTPRHGMPSFPQLLQAIWEAWGERRADVEATGQRIVDALAARSLPASGSRLPAFDEMAIPVNALAASFDPVWGGFGSAPKFPPSMVLEFLLRYAARDSGEIGRSALTMAERTMEGMARGGMYDQLGGGFARYSVDAHWVVPHFEKMLYDNALLLRVYLHWWRLTSSEFARRVVHETAEFLIRDLRTPEGGFASALDADSEGVEGKFYAWTREQLVEVLGEEDGRWAAEVFTVTDAGTFEHGASVLQLLTDPSDRDRYVRVRASLWAARETRVHPGRDDKVVAAWNGLAIAALAEAGALFDEPTWLDAAVAAADLLIAVHMNLTDRLWRTSRDGRAGANLGVLDDYGDVAEGFLALYWATGDDEWLTFAGILLDVAVTHFSDEDGGFCDTADDAPALIRRPREASDNAEPSGWFAVANALVTYAAIVESPEHRERAEQALGVVAAYGSQAPRAAGWGLSALLAVLDGPAEVTVDPDARDLVRVARMSPAPGTVLRYSRDARDTGAMVCRHSVCQLPTMDAERLAASLMAGRSAG
jgi:uncharacterized protein YyaL (SSP411 family)